MPVIFEINSGQAKERDSLLVLAQALFQEKLLSQAPGARARVAPWRRRALHPKAEPSVCPPKEPTVLQHLLRAATLNIRNFTTGQNEPQAASAHLSFTLELVDL